MIVSYEFNKGGASGLLDGTITVIAYREWRCDKENFSTSGLQDENRIQGLLNTKQG